MSLPEARRKRILGDDDVAGNAFGVRASGLADRRYGMPLWTSPLRYLAARRILIWDTKPESVATTLNPKIRAPENFI